MRIYLLSTNLLKKKLASEFFDCFEYVRLTIRQGDPIAMLLYIIYVEPLLQALEKRMKGLKVTGIGKSLEAYCDDINVITDSLADFDVVDNVIGKFEKVSGAILSRNKKCKVIDWIWELGY